MKELNTWWHRMPKAVRKPVVFIIGSVVVIIGLAMLVLPGPGWAAIFFGFAILATEFVFAEKARDWLVAQLKKLLHASKHAWQKLISREP